ncbi:hypothetical protein HI914_07256 [Erysiphe necator]|nr:hypothetical protein HI914_07256 [Erysiphe necator]
MLYLSYISYLCALVFFCLSVAQANWLNDNILAYQRYGFNIQARQLDPPPDETTVTGTPSGTGVATTSTSNSAPKASTTTTLTSQTLSPPTSTPAITSTSSSKHNTESSSTTTKQITTDTPNPITRTTTFEPSTTIELITSVVTVSGSVVTSVSSSTEITKVPSEPTSSSSPVNSSSGLGSKTKNTIVGVVAGIIGLAILAGIIIVTRKLLSRRRARDPNRGWSDFGTGAQVNDNVTGMSNTRPINPFQSTLENYHNPARLNASSNF